MNRLPFPLVWDNTQRSTFAACPQKFWWEYGQHYKPQSISTDLHAGKAFAEGLEVARMAFYRDKMPEAEAFALGLAALGKAYGDFEPPMHKQNKSLPRLMEAFRYYGKAFPFATDPCQPYMGKNGPMVEFSFALPLDAESLLHPETGEPIIYSGRADMIATYAGALSVYDDKTTSQLGPSWGNQWNRRSQFTGYVWAAREFGIPVTQVVIRGIAILKTDLNHAENIQARSQAHVNEWRYQAIRDIRRAIECWKEGYWDLNLSDTCSAYGGCMFQQPCMSPDPQPWLDTSFTKRVWNPLTRSEEENPK